MAIPPPLAGGYQLWHYYPSVPGGIVMAVLFLILALTHLWFIIKTKKMFCLPMLIGAIFEIVGYGARVLAHYNNTSTLPYAIQSLLILLAPILFAATIYMLLGHIIHATGGQQHCLVPARFLTKIFVCGDVACFFIQSAGGGTLATAKSDSKSKLGEDLILAGLVLQIIIFGLFVAVASIFHVRMRRDATADNMGSVRWRQLLLTLYIASFLITIRNVVRAIEYGMGGGGYLMTHEWVAFVFDGTAMILVLIVGLAWYHSGIRSREKIEDSTHISMGSRSSNA